MTHTYPLRGEKTTLPFTLIAASTDDHSLPFALIFASPSSSAPSSSPRSPSAASTSRSRSTAAVARNTLVDTRLDGEPVILHRAVVHIIGRAALSVCLAVRSHLYELVALLGDREQVLLRLVGTFDRRLEARVGAEFASRPLLARRVRRGVRSGVRRTV